VRVIRDQKAMPTIQYVRIRIPEGTGSTFATSETIFLPVEIISRRTRNRPEMKGVQFGPIKRVAEMARWERQMVSISKGMAVAAALIAFALVTVDDTARGLAKSAPYLAQSRDATPDSVVIQESAMRQRAASALRELVARQKAKSVEPGRVPVAEANCREQTWPFYTGNCLVPDNGAQVPAAIRVIAIQRVADNSMQPTGQQ
jgi:hypothetical protein